VQATQPAHRLCDAGAMKERESLVGTWEAARAVGMHPATLQRWAAAGRLTPTEETIGGHLRWDVDQLREQVQRIKDARRAERRRKSGAEPR
jgi:predicted site-specific integrase-resolvase